MSGYKGHSIGAVVLLLVAMHYFGNYFHKPDLIDIILYGAVAVMFGLWPDVDIKSKGQKIFYSIFFVTDLYLIINQEYKNCCLFWFNHYSANFGSASWLDSYTYCHDFNPLAHTAISNVRYGYSYSIGLTLLRSSGNRIFLSFIAG